MYTYFFTYQDALPENCGFPLFGGIHFIWLTCIAIGIFLLCRTYLRLTKTRQLQILNTTVLLALCCTFMQDAILTVTGHMNARTLPFHLCDLAGFFYLLLPRKKGQSEVPQFWLSAYRQRHLGFPFPGSQTGRRSVYS